MRPSDSFYSAAGDKKLIGHTEDSILLESDSVRLKDPSQLPELKDPRLRAKRSTHRAAMYDKVKIQNESEALSMTDSISVEEYRRIQKSLIGDSIKSANSSFMSASVVNTSQKKQRTVTQGLLANRPPVGGALSARKQRDSANLGLRQELTHELLTS